MGGERAWRRCGGTAYGGEEGEKGEEGREEDHCPLRERDKKER